MKERKKLLFHTCCAPCTVFPYQILKNTELRITLFFYNPNIHPEEEYVRRKSVIEGFAAEIKVPLIIYDPDMNGLSPAQREELWRSYPEDERCSMCYEARLDAAARYASDNYYDAFSSTLLGSIYQDHEKIISISEKCSARYGIDFFYQDLREGFRKGQRDAREMGMYRQKYCGCIESLDKSPFKDKILFTLKNENYK